MTASYQLLFCTCPDVSTAESLAQQLVELQLAACVNIIPQLQSIYRWQGKIETTTECLLLIKSRAELYAAVESKIQALHPYQVPEILAVDIQQGFPAYLNWLNENVKVP